MKPLTMTPGKIVYLCWYDFQREKEYILSGEVMDNALYGGTQWEYWVLVQFKPVSMSKPICHHFRPEQLSVDSGNVPHDEAYLVCGKGAKPNYQQVKDNPWLVMTQFKRDHWDDAHNRLQVDALDEFYRLWLIAINWRIGYETKQRSKPTNGHQCLAPQRRETPTATASPCTPAASSPLPAAPVHYVAVSQQSHPKQQPTVVQLSLFD